MASTKVSSISFPVKSVSSRQHSWEVVSGVVSSGVYTCTRTRVGSRLAKWKEIVAAGGNATTGLTAQWDTFDSGQPVKDCTVNLHSTLDGSTATHTMSGMVGVMNTDHSFTMYGPSLPVTETDNAARAKFYGKLYALRTSLQGGVVLGELRETLHMLKRPAAALWDKNFGYLSALRKAKRRDPKHWLKTAGGLWLEQSFGWQPLINDCKDAYKAYEKLVGPNLEETIPISAGAVRLYDQSSSQLVSQHRAGWLFSVNQSQQWQTDAGRLLEQHKVRYKGAVRCLTRATQWDNLELFGFDAGSFVPTAWELLPWSFLVDYFTNIGDLLTAFVTKTSNVAWVNRSTLKTAYFAGQVSHRRIKPAGFDASWWVLDRADESSYNWSATRKTVSRAADVGIPMPNLQFNFDLSDRQLGNVAALLSQFNGLHRQGFRYRPT